MFQELLKYTSEDHPDHAQVVAARDAMREVAMHINETKRRMENIGKIGRWQESIEGWKVCVCVCAHIYYSEFVDFGMGLFQK